MNLTKLCRSNCNKYLTTLRTAHSAVSTSREAEVEALQKQEPKCTKNVSGISIASVENYSPITQISVLVKAGSRYEQGQNLGVVHCLRNSAILSSKNRTAFSLVRHLELDGGRIEVSSTREYMIYTLQCIRDHINKAFPILTEIATQQAFKPWEVSDANPRMKVDLAMYKKNPEALLMEALHKAAFRGGLNNSLYSPDYMIGKHDSEMLHDFVQNTFTSPRTFISGVGIAHDYLETIVNQNVSLKTSDASAATSKFGGGEVRVDANFPYARAAIVAEGAGLNSKELLSLGVLQSALGTGPIAKHSLGESTKLGAAASKSTSHPFSVSSINISYSDTGLFGIYIAGYPDDMKNLVKAVVSQMREVTKKLSDEEIQNGKHALKAKMLLEMSNSKDLVENMALQTAATGTLRNAPELEKAIDSLSAADVNAVACKVMKTKPAMAAIGPLHNTPYLDELL